MLLTPRSWNLFDGIPEQQVAVRVFSREKDIPFSVVITREGEETPVYRQTIPALGTQDLKWDFNKFPVGVYCLKVSCESLNKTWEWNITKNPQKAESVLIRNEVPYVNGKPYLFLGLYHVSDRVREIVNKGSAEGASEFILDRDTMLREVKERGFNTIGSTYGAGTRDFHESAAKYGLMIVPEIDVFNENQTKDVLGYQSNFGWYAIDEPSPDKMEEAQRIYRQCKKLDPYRPVITCIWPDQTGVVGRKLVDIVCVDKYPIGEPNSSLEGDAAWVKTGHEIFVKDDPASSVFIIPQLFTYPIKSGYEPTYEQIRAEVYTGIVSGAKGVFYFSYWEPQVLEKGMSQNPKRKHWYLRESKLWNEIGSLNKELMSIQDVILLGQAADYLNINKPESVLYRAVVLPNGERYLMIVNPRAESQGKFTVAGLKANEKLVPAVESPKCSLVSDGVWQVDISGYMVAVYKISTNN